MTKKNCPLGEDCDLTLAWMMGADDARDRTKARIEELERILSSSPCEIAAHSNSLTEYMFHWEGRALDAEAKLAKAVEALEGCMIGGNHLVTWLPENHLPADTDPLAALVRHGAGVSHDIWCCWRSIMQARATLAELKGDKP
jgi:hypothetical protein